MIRTRIQLSLVAASLALALTSTAFADDAPPAPAKGEKLVAQGAGGLGGGASGGTLKDESEAGAKNEKELEESQKNAFAGSMVLFDQSFTTNSLSKGAQLSDTPLYEWWISPRLYYTYKDHFKFGARFDFYKEFTNHEETTYAHEWRPGDPWLTAAYGDQAFFFNKHEKSRFALGLLAKPPLAKESRGNGQYLALGPTGALSFGFDVMGKKSTYLQTASVGLYVVYQHSFARCTTPCGFGFAGYPANVNSNVDPYGTGGQLSTADQVRSATLAGDTLIYALLGEIDILENLSFNADFFWIDQWSHAPTDASVGGVAVPHSPNDTRFRQLTWFLTTIDYDPIEEMTLSLGYYNLNTLLAPDSTWRNPFWSPDSRIFIDVTAHLDALYDDATKAKKPPQTALTHFQAFH